MPGRIVAIGRSVSGEPGLESAKPKDKRRACDYERSQYHGGNCGVAAG